MRAHARAFTAREVIAGKDSRTLAREIVAMAPEEFSAAFRNSPNKRAKLRGLQRNAAVLLENIGNPDGVQAPEATLGKPEPLGGKRSKRD